MKNGFLLLIKHLDILTSGGRNKWRYKATGMNKIDLSLSPSTSRIEISIFYSSSMKPKFAKRPRPDQRKKKEKEASKKLTSAELCMQFLNFSFYTEKGKDYCGPQCISTYLRGQFCSSSLENVSMQQEFLSWFPLPSFMLAMHHWFWLDRNVNLKNASIPTQPLYKYFKNG